MRDPTIEASGEQIMRLELQGYETREKLGRHDDIYIYRLQRYEDGLFAIAKTTRDAHPDEKQFAAFRHEYDLLRTLDGRGVLKAYGLEYEGERPVLLLQDIGGSTLDQLIRERGEATDLQELLGIVVGRRGQLDENSSGENHAERNFPRSFDGQSWEPRSKVRGFETGSFPFRKEPVIVDHGSSRFDFAVYLSGADGEVGRVCGLSVRLLRAGRCAL